MSSNLHYLEVDLETFDSNWKKSFLKKKKGSFWTKRPIPGPDQWFFESKKTHDIKTIIWQYIKKNKNKILAIRNSISHIKSKLDPNFLFNNLGYSYDGFDLIYFSKKQN